MMFKLLPPPGAAVPRLGRCRGRPPARLKATYAGRFRAVSLPYNVTSKAFPKIKYVTSIFYRDRATAYIGLGRTEAGCFSGFRPRVGGRKYASAFYFNR